MQAVRRRLRAGAQDPQAGQGRARARQRSGSTSRSGCRDAAQRGRGAGRRRGDDQDHRRGRRQAGDRRPRQDHPEGGRAQRARAPAGSVPQKLTPQQKQRGRGRDQGADVTVYTGAEDQILRRLTVNADLKDAASKIDAALLLDLTFTKVGAGAADRRARRTPKPFTELLKALDAAGLADLGLGGAQRRRATSTPEQPARRRTTWTSTPRCIEQAKGDRAKARKCAELLVGLAAHARDSSSRPRAVCSAQR